MAKVNTVQGSLVPISAGPQGQLNPGQMMAAGAGISAIGRGLSQVAQVTEGLAQTLQKAKNTADLAAADHRRNNTLAEFEEHMATQPDESKWGDEWAALSKKTSDDLQNQDGLSPIVREQMALDNMDWSNRTAVNIKGAATKRQIKRFGAQIQGAANQAFEDGRLEEGYIYLDSLVSEGIIHPDELPALRRQGLETSSLAAAHKDILDNPILAEKNVEDESLYPGISSAQRRSLKVKAIRDGNQVRVDTMDEIQRQRNEGRLYSEEELDKLVKQDILKATQAKYVIDEQIRSGNDPVANERAVRALDAIDAWDPTGDENTNSTFTQLGLELAGLPSWIVEEGKRTLKAKRNRAASASTRKLADARIDSIYNSGAWGSLSKIDGDATYPDEFDEANRTKAAEKAELTQWIAANPNASELDILNHVEERNAESRSTLQTKEGKGNGENALWNFLF
jgi:hypothetical protein